MKYERLVVAYHGCDRDVARRILSGSKFEPSKNDYDWLGNGIYFWEYGVDRALRFATDVQMPRGRVKNPAVVGALIHLGRCLDLLDTANTAPLSRAYPIWRNKMKAQGTLPKNSGPLPDRKLRRRDCAVMNWYLDRTEENGGSPFQTVRCAFREGKPIFPSAGIYRENHIQLSVRDPSCIIGVFRPS